MRNYSPAPFNIGNRLAQAEQIKSMRQKNMMNQLGLQQAQEATQQKNRLKELRGAAFGGQNQGALQELAAESPAEAQNMLALQQAQSAIGPDEYNRRAAIGGKLASGIMQASPESRGAVYQSAVADAAGQGLDVANLPPEYSPEIEPTLNFLIDQAGLRGKAATAQSPEGKLGSDIKGGFTSEAQIRRLKNMKQKTGDEKLSLLEEEKIKKDVKQLGKIEDAATTAESTISQVNQMRQILEKVKGTGMPFGLSSPLLAALPGGDTKADREAVRSLGMSLQLNLVERTKGAISNKEMAMFAGATPGLNNTQEANRKLLNGMEAAASRQIEKESFNEEWINRYGNLDGATGSWNKFMDENEVIDKDFNIVESNIANWDNYLAKDAKKAQSKAKKEFSFNVESGQFE